MVYLNSTNGEKVMLEKEYDYFIRNKETLLKDYAGKFVVIVGEEIVGSYPRQEDALKEASQKYPLGTFLIQKVSDNPDDITQRFFSAGVCFH